MTSKSIRKRDFRTEAFSLVFVISPKYPRERPAAGLISPECSHLRPKTVPRLFPEGYSRLMLRTQDRGQAARLKDFMREVAFTPAGVRERIQTDVLAGRHKENLSLLLYRTR